MVAGAIINLAMAWGIAHWVHPFKGRGGAIGLNGRQALWSRLQKDHWPRDLVHEGSTVGKSAPSTRTFSAG